jgi:lysozyme family protein
MMSSDLPTIIKGETRLSRLKDQYAYLYGKAIIRPAFQTPAQMLAGFIKDNETCYKAVAAAVNPELPWQFVGAIHAMECSGDFRCHLHNGDPLSDRTVHEPVGRPLGTPPFNWETSAIDALKLRELDRVQDWSLPAQLWQAEGYNGFGYRLFYPEVLSPYLWSGTHWYTKGKYTADGSFDSHAISVQVGVAVIFYALAETAKALC